MSGSDLLFRFLKLELRRLDAQQGLFSFLIARLHLGSLFLKFLLVVGEVDDAGIVLLAQLILQMVLQLIGIHVALGQETALVQHHAIQQLDIGVIDQRVSVSLNEAATPKTYTGFSLSLSFFIVKAEHTRKVKATAIINRMYFIRLSVFKNSDLSLYKGKDNKKNGRAAHHRRFLKSFSLSPRILALSSEVFCGVLIYISTKSYLSPHLIFRLSTPMGSIT